MKWSNSSYSLPFTDIDFPWAKPNFMLYNQHSTCERGSTRKRNLTINYVKSPSPAFWEWRKLDNKLCETTVSCILRMKIDIFTDIFEPFLRSFMRKCSFLSIFSSPYVGANARIIFTINGGKLFLLHFENVNAAFLTNIYEFLFFWSDMTYIS